MPNRQELDFADQNPSFTNGFEVGLIYQQLTDGEVLIEARMVHSENRAILDKVGRYFNCSVEWMRVDGFDEWSYVTIRKQVSKKVRKKS